ncbi:hypothetical protein ACWYXJ_29725 [Janthinobacterium lividum]|uniref:hypothetical protein n=1 Tax=unclassified Janthinobacterium TaxID=2610881 RepID=UPI000875678A|nr:MULTISPECIES: hypothetical protein [unclassified Janthinobacterium]
MNIRDAARKVGKGIIWAILPVYAWRKLISTKDSVSRIADMARRGNTPRAEDMHGLELERYELEQKGREIVLGLEEHERFEYMAGQLGFTDDVIAEKMRALGRAHAIRFCLLIFTLVITIGLTYRFGFRPFVFGSAATLYLSATCVKTACLYTQLEERALWSFGQLIGRAKMWIWRRSFWFLD